MAYLEENGFAVFKDVASPEEVEKGRRMAWDYLEQVTPGVKRDNPQSWDTPKWPDPFGKGIVCADGVGHSEFLWFVRGIDKVQRIYQKIWNTNDIITSFDGFCIHRAWEYNHNWRTKEGEWYHLDQNGHAKPAKICVQGFLNFYPAGEEDGGLIVVPKSQTIFNSIFKNRPKLKERGDFIQLHSDKSVWEGEIKAAKLAPIKVCAESGDFIVWDSRVIHCNAPAPSSRPIPEDGTILPPRRLVAYVCMTPRSRVGHSQISARIRAYKEGATTSHWPEECLTLNARKNHNANYVPLQLNESQKKLIPME